MIRQGDAFDLLKEMPRESVDCVITSPPYWGLRDYGVSGQIGLEKSPEEYISKLTEIFCEVRSVLKKSGTLWLNLGDSYVSSGGTGHQGKHGERYTRSHTQRNLLGNSSQKARLPPTNLMGMPWRLAFALQSDGWILRSDIIWHKRNPMPESVQNRPTKSHEYLFLFAKSRKYFYDSDSIKEPCADDTNARYGRARAARNKWTDGPLPSPSAIGERAHSGHPGYHKPQSIASSLAQCARVSTRNKRTVWTLSNQGYAGAHFATFPPKLVEPCVLAGCPEEGLIIDPFAGSGTVGVVAIQNNRKFIGIELNPKYCELARERIEGARYPP